MVILGRFTQVISVLWASFLIFAPAAYGQEMPPTLVGTDTVSMMEFNRQVTLVGRSEGTSSSQIVSEVTGQVAAIVAPEGNAVNKGATLIEIDADRLKLDLAAKEAEVSEAEVQGELARANLKRSEELFAKNLSRDISVDSSRAWVSIAESRHKKLSAERDRLARDVEDCRVKAPFAGFTSQRLVSVGEWVNRGTPVYELVDISRLRVVADLPERYYGRVPIGGTVTIFASGDTTTPVEGKVTGVARNANSETHTYPVIIDVENKEAKLGGGALVRAIISLDQVFSSLAVSKDAIVRQGPQTMVYTIHEGKAAPMPVMTSASKGNMVAISAEGLAPGMTVVTRGNERIFPGAPVRTSEPGSGDGASPGVTP